MTDQGARWIVLDGELFGADAGMLERLTPGKTRRNGIFETCLVRGGRVVFLREHLRRMRRGAARSGLGPVPALNGVRAAAALCLKENRIRNGRLRVALWLSRGRIRWAVVAEAVPACRGRGLTATVSAKRVTETNPFVSLKRLVYQPYSAAFQLARGRGFDEALLLNRKGELVEGSRTNIFWVKDKRLFTPARSCGCLPGIVRAKILVLAREHGLACRCVRTGVEALRAADEAFLTSSCLGVAPLVSVDGTRVGGRGPGPLTRRLGQWYRQGPAAA